MFTVKFTENPLDFFEKLLYSTNNSNNYKPLTGTSTFLEHAQRTADGGIAVMGRMGNGPVRAN